MLFFFFLRSSIFQHVSIQIVYLVQSCTDDLLESFKKKTPNDQWQKHPFTFSFKMQVGMTTELTHAPVYEQSQLGAAADYLLIK